MSRIVEKCPISQCWRILQKVLDADSEADDCQTFISSSLCNHRLRYICGKTFHENPFSSSSLSSSSTRRNYWIWVPGISCPHIFVQGVLNSKFRVYKVAFSVEIDRIMYSKLNRKSVAASSFFAVSAIFLLPVCAEVVFIVYRLSVLLQL